jgi:hypothetical protein
MQIKMNDKRQEVLKYFDAFAKIEAETTYGISERGLYYFEIEKYQQHDENRNWIITKVQIFDMEKAICLFEYLTDHDDENFAWITIKDIEYLIYPEFLGGYSLFDTSTLQLHSYYNENDAFIWQNIYFNPEKNQLIVEGNYWACPSERIIYDCKNITQLPYPILERFYL